MVRGRSPVPNSPSRRSSYSRSARIKQFEWDDEAFDLHDRAAKWTLAELRMIERWAGKRLEDTSSTTLNIAIIFVSIRRARPEFKLSDLNRIKANELRQIQEQIEVGQEVEVPRHSRAPRRSPDGGLLAECERLIDENWILISYYFKQMPSALEDLTIERVHALCLTAQDMKKRDEAGDK